MVSVSCTSFTSRVPNSGTGYWYQYQCRYQCLVPVPDMGVSAHTSQYKCQY